MTGGDRFPTPAAPPPSLVSANARHYVYDRYFFRSAALRHLRLEQFNRYLALAGEGDGFTPQTNEDTVEHDDAVPEDSSHRNYDQQMECTPAGTKFLACCKHVPGCRRRKQACLGVSRLPFIEPIGDSRESFFEQKLVLALPWFCPEQPKIAQDAEGNSCTEYTFCWDPPNAEELGGQQLRPEVLKLGRKHVSFEMMCNRLETDFCDAELGLVCACCAEELPKSVCPSCRHAIGWHRCELEPNHLVWRKGSLHAGSLDVQRVLYNLHRKLVPTDAIKDKAKEYVQEGLISKSMAERIVLVIEAERGSQTYVNDVPADGPAAADSHLTTQLSPEQLRELLAKREAMMQAGQTNDDGNCDHGVTDQWRVYEFIKDSINTGKFLRLMVQASAGSPII